MDRKEALDFLELPEFASPEEIRARLEARLNYFEELGEKAPSQFVRKLHARNVAKVKEIIQLSKTWPAARMPETAEQAAAPELIIDAPPLPVPELIIGAPPPPPPPTFRTDAQHLPPAAAEPLAWLIRHTENQSPVTLPVLPGKNFLGRKEKPGLIPFIRIEEDPYISKVHAVVIAEPGNPAVFYVADDLASKDEKASTNGTYLNGRDARIGEKIRIKNNDTIQIGITKLILRYNNKELARILEEVETKDYMHTVVIDNL
jgi:FHA domain